MHNVITPLYIGMLFLLMGIGCYNVVYRLKIRKLSQLGIELPGISLTLLKLGTYMAIFSGGVIVFFILLS